MKSLSGWVNLLRPLNVVITGLVVMVGGIMGLKSEGISYPPLMLAALSAMLVTGGSNAINDYYDRAIDAINRPLRPIPSGQITARAAWWGGVALILTGIGTGFRVSYVCGTIASGVSLLLWGYSAYLKHRPMVGNLAVGLSGGLAFLYGGLAVSHPEQALFPSLFAFLIHIAREIIKDVEDLPGDGAFHSRTLPVVVGVRGASRIAAALLSILVVFTFLPYFMGLYSTRYLLLVTLLTNLPLIWVIVQLNGKSPDKKASQLSNILKGTMLGGLLALYVG